MLARDDLDMKIIVKNIRGFYDEKNAGFDPCDVVSSM